MFSSIRGSCLSVGVVHSVVGSGLRAWRVLAPVPKSNSKYCSRDIEIFPSESLIFFVRRFIRNPSCRDDFPVIPQ